MPSFKSNDIAFQKAATLCRFQFWVVYITNTGLRRLRHDSPIFTDKLGSINCGRQRGYSVPRAQHTAERLRRCATVQLMGVGPSESACRSRLQTTFGGFVQKARS